MSPSLDNLKEFFPSVSHALIEEIYFHKGNDAFETLWNLLGTKTRASDQPMSRKNHGSSNSAKSKNCHPISSSSKKTTDQQRHRNKSDQASNSAKIFGTSQSTHYRNKKQNNPPTNQLPAMSRVQQDAERESDVRTGQESSPSETFFDNFPGASSSYQGYQSSYVSGRSSIFSTTCVKTRARLDRNSPGLTSHTKHGNSEDTSSKAKHGNSQGLTSQSIDGNSLDLTTQAKDEVLLGLPTQAKDGGLLGSASRAKDEMNDKGSEDRESGMTDISESSLFLQRSVKSQSEVEIIDVGLLPPLPPGICPKKPPSTSSSKEKKKKPLPRFPIEILLEAESHTGQTKTNVASSDSVTVENDTEIENEGTKLEEEKQEGEEGKEITIVEDQETIIVEEEKTKEVNRRKEEKIEVKQQEETEEIASREKVEEIKEVRSEKENQEEEKKSNSKNLVIRHVSQAALRFKLSSELPPQLIDKIQKACKESPDFPKVKPSLEKTIKLKVIQISRSARQVRVQSKVISDILDSMEQNEMLFYGYHQFARAIVNRCRVISEGTIFPVAQVARNIGKKHPLCLTMILTNLHKVCPLTVPMFWTHDDECVEARDHYHQLMGYLTVKEGTSEVAESEDKYLERQAGFVMFYAAFVVAAPKGDPYGVEAGWQYLSRFLNVLPANRTTATALYAFLKVAGNCLYFVYQNQFRKILLFIEKKFLPLMTADADDDLPALSRLKTYIVKEQYHEIPASLKMPTEEESNYIRA